MKGKLTMDNMLGVKDVKGVLVDLLAKLTSDDWQSWLTEVKKFLRKEPCWVENVKTWFNPHTYFKTREGLWVSEQFADRVLSKQPNMMPYRGLGGVVENTLPQGKTYQEVINEYFLGTEEVRSNAFTLDQIASLIDLQQNGAAGRLLNTGHPNIFYVLVDGTLQVVDVGWSFSSHDWGVDTWRLGGRIERAGGRVFSNTTL